MPREKIKVYTKVSEPSESGTAIYIQHRIPVERFKNDRKTVRTLLENMMNKMVGGDDFAIVFDDECSLCGQVKYDNRCYNLSCQNCHVIKRADGIKCRLTLVEENMP